MIDLLMKFFAALIGMMFLAALGGCSFGGQWNTDLTQDETAETVTWEADAKVKMVVDTSGLAFILPGLQAP